MAFLNTDCGRRVYYEDYGSGKRAVLLIHGWGFSCRAWDNTLPALLGAGHRVVMIDHRGCGRSDKDFPDLGIEAIAGDVVNLVAALGLESVVLNGWSLGGAVAVEAADRLGKRCAGLALTGGATPIYTQKPDFAAGGTDADVAATLAGLVADRITFLAGLSQAVCAKDVGEPRAALDVAGLLRGLAHGARDPGSVGGPGSAPAVGEPSTCPLSPSSDSRTCSWRRKSAAGWASTIRMPA
jgi:non-heme chloroperoxidase